VTLRNVILTGFIVLSCAVSTGCGSNESEAETRERERADLEERARMDAEAANRAITEINRRMFGKKSAEPSVVSTEDEATETMEKGPRPASDSPTERRP
jgi:hypothetical protein